jgi:hypothetical protein
VIFEMENLFDENQVASMSLCLNLEQKNIEDVSVKNTKNAKTLQYLFYINSVIRGNIGVCTEICIKILSKLEFNIIRKKTNNLNQEKTTF